MSAIADYRGYMMNLNLSSFETATGIDLADYGHAYATSEHVAEFALCAENDYAFVQALRAAALLVSRETTYPHPDEWQMLTTLWQADAVMNALVAWDEIDDHPLFVKQVITWMVLKMEG